MQQWPSPSEVPHRSLPPGAGLEEGCASSKMGIQALSVLARREVRLALLPPLLRRYGQSLIATSHPARRFLALPTSRVTGKSPFEVSPMMPLP
jgi:hypothetical protein